MQQMSVDPSQIVTVEYSDAAILLKPVVFKDGDSFCCILGPDPQMGVFGCGNTPEEALEEWNDQLKLRLKRSNQDDEVVQMVMGKISEKKAAPSWTMQDFYSQFRPIRKK